MLILLILAIWLACGFVCANMAAKRGRSAGLWFLLGLVFGVFAVLVLAVIEPKKTQSYDIRSIAVDSYRITEAPLAEKPLPAPVETFDRKRWQTLLEVDQDLASAARAVKSYGPEYEDELADKYLSLNDKSYLPAIVDRLRERGEVELQRKRKLAETMNSDSVEQLLALEKQVSLNNNIDNLTGKRIRQIEPYSGPAASFAGGILVEFEDGTLELRHRGLKRPFDDRASMKGTWL